MLSVLTLGGGFGGAAMLNVAHAAEATAAATTQARTESTVNLTTKDFTGEAPKETIQNYVNWVVNQDKVSPFSADNTTTYKVNVADLVGKGLTIKPGTLQLGIGAYGGAEGSFDLPIYGDEDTATPRATTLQYGHGKGAPITVTADADGTISIPRPDDAKMDINVLYSVEVEGGKTVTQMITIKAPEPAVEAGTFSASTTLGELGTTKDAPTEVKVNESGKVTFTYTNNSKLTATTATGSPKDDQKIHLTIARDGNNIELPVVEIAPGETKTFSVENIAASSKAGEVTGADFKLTEALPQNIEYISVRPCDHLAASPIIAPSTTADFLKLFTSGTHERVAPILPDGATVNLHDAKAPADYIGTYKLGGTCGDEPYESYINPYNGQMGIGFGGKGASNYYDWNEVKQNVTDYSVYVKPVEVAEPTPEPTPTVTPEPTPSETPAPTPSKSVTPPAPTVEPSPSTPAESPTPEPVPTSPTAVPSVDPTPTATTPVPSVSPSEPAVVKPSEPGVKPSEPAKPVEAKTGHEFDSAKPVLGGILGAVALGAVAGLWIFGRKKKGEAVKPEATTSETEAETTAEGTESK
jgi:singapore isolate B (sub-type 7) whole genome shotgun sequence assembly, scaffold_4